MNDVTRAKFGRIMAQVAELEDRVTDLEEELRGPESADPQERALLQEELRELQEQLAKARSELTRLSDGCGKPHPTS
jgi:hypothetical protein